MSNQLILVNVYCRVKRGSAVNEVPYRNQIAHRVGIQVRLWSTVKHGWGRMVSRISHQSSPISTRIVTLQWVHSDCSQQFRWTDLNSRAILSIIESNYDQQLSRFVVKSSSGLSQQWSQAMVNIWVELRSAVASGKYQILSWTIVNRWYALTVEGWVRLSRTRMNSWESDYGQQSSHTTSTVESCYRQ